MRFPKGNRFGRAPRFRGAENQCYQETRPHPCEEDDHEKNDCRRCRHARPVFCPLCRTGAQPVHTVRRTGKDRVRTLQRSGNNYCQASERQNTAQCLRGMRRTETARLHSLRGTGVEERAAARTASPGTEKLRNLQRQGKRGMRPVPEQRLQGGKVRLHGLHRARLDIYQYSKWRAGNLHFLRRKRHKSMPQMRRLRAHRLPQLQRHGVF